MVDVLLVIPPGGLLRYPSLGIAYMAALLRERQFKVEVLDAVALRLTYQDVLKIIVEKQPKIVGLTVITYNIPQIYPLITSIKKELVNATIVVGGPHINAVPTAALNELKADFGFHGDCELHFAEFCNRKLANEKGFENGDYPGLIFRSAQGIQINPPYSASAEELDALPFPARDMFPLEKYFSPHNSDSKGFSASLLSSRGCPGRCVFCANPSRTIRFRSAENVLSEIAQLQAMGAGYIEFVDDMFLTNRKRAALICQQLAEASLKFSWGIQTTANSLDEQIISQLSRAGCVKMAIGVESGVERIRNIIRKPIKSQQLFSIAASCRAHGIKLMAYYMFGHPSETVSDMNETIRCACQLNTDYADFNPTVCLPGTEIFEIAVREGKISRDHWHKYMLGKAGVAKYIPSGVTEKAFNRIFRKAYLVFYLRPAYMLSLIRSVKSTKDISNIANLAALFIKTLYISTKRIIR